MSTVISVGSINADLYLRLDEPVRGPGTVSASDPLRSSGGKAANRAVVSRHLGAEAILIGRVGDDDLAEQALAGPRSLGVDTVRVRRAAGHTGMAAILVPPDGDKTIALALGANDRPEGLLDDVRDAVACAPRGSVLALDLETSSTVVSAAVEVAHDRGLVVVADPAPPDRVLLDLLALVDHVTPDHREAEALTGIDASTRDGAAEAARALRDLGVGAAHVKLSDGGCMTASAGGIDLVEPRDVAVVDKTGAGDAFAGALAAGLALDLGVGPATDLAVSASSVAVGGYGSQEAYAPLAHLAPRLDG